MLAIVAASAFAIVTGKKAAGLYDHALGRHLRIAAERRDDRLQAYDGEHSTGFGGTLPDLHDESGKPFASFTVEGATVRVYDRAAGGFYEAVVEDAVVQIFDHRSKTWFPFTIQAA